MEAIEVLAQEEKNRVQELYFSALVYVTIAFLEAEDSRKKDIIPMISALIESFEQNPIETGTNLYAAGFFAGALIFGIAVGSPLVTPVIATVSLTLGALTFFENHNR